MEGNVRYRVTFEDITYYDYDVEASSKEEAEALTKDLAMNGNWHKQVNLYELRDGSCEIIEIKEL